MSSYIESGVSTQELIAVLREELDALQTWLGAEANADITDGMFISIDKIKRVLGKAGEL